MDKKLVEIFMAKYAKSFPCVRLKEDIPKKKLLGFNGIIFHCTQMKLKIYENCWIKDKQMQKV